MEIEYEAKNQVLPSDVIECIEELASNGSNFNTGKLDVQKITSYKDLSDRFFSQTQPSESKPPKLYFQRYNKLKQSFFNLLKAAHRAPTSITDIKKGQQASVVGILYKETYLNPKVVKKMNLQTAMGANKFQNPGDVSAKVFIEDEEARTRLVIGDKTVFKNSDLAATDQVCTVSDIITGMVVAILGFSDDERTIYAEQILIDDTLHQDQEDVYYQFLKEAKITGFQDHTNIKRLHPVDQYICTPSKEDRYIVLVSGLNFSYNKSRTVYNQLKAFLLAESTSAPISMVNLERLHLKEL